MTPRIRQSRFNHFRSLAVIVLSPLLALIAQAETYDYQPFSGSVYNTGELSSITYDCKLAVAERMTCEFTKVRVSKKTRLEDIPAKMKEWDRYTKKEVMKNECSQMKEIFERWDGRHKAPEPIEYPDPRDKVEAERVMKEMKEICATNDFARLRSLTEAGYRQEMRTCRVSTYNSKLTFKRVTDVGEKSSAWVAASEPEGPCGIVQLSSFEIGNRVGLITWNYVERKAITNPKGGAALQQQCSELNEEPSEYSWRSKDAPRWADCDKIQFSIF